jgi:hypothetical protein
MKLEFSRQNFEKYSNIKFHENPSSGSRVVPCRQTDGRTDMTKLIVPFRNFGKAPKNGRAGQTTDENKIGSTREVIFVPVNGDKNTDTHTRSICYYLYLQLSTLLAVVMPTLPVL